MPDYRRSRVPGGIFFFTVNLLDRRSNLLVANIDALRDAVRRVRARTPFHIDAWSSSPTTCTVCGRCRKTMPIFRVDGERSRRDSQNRCRLANRDHRS